MDEPVTRNRTVLGHDCHIRGELWLDNDLTLLGQFDGTLQVGGTLEIGASAQVKGRILCGTLRLSGQADAEVVAEVCCQLLAGARLSGRLYTPRLEMQADASVQAQVCIGPQALEQAGQLVESTPEGEAGVETVCMPDDVPARQAAAGAPLAAAPSAASVQTVPANVRQALDHHRPPRVIRAAPAGGAAQ